MPASQHRGHTDTISNPYKGKRGLARLRRALVCSVEGLAGAFRHEDAFRQEVLLASLLVPIALVLGSSGPSRALMVGAVLMVLVVELLNTGIETVTDHVSLEEHVLAKRAKDVGSAAVMVALVNVPVVWLLVLTG